MLFLYVYMITGMSPLHMQRECWVVTKCESGKRLDTVVSIHLDEVSRAQAKRWILNKGILLNGGNVRPSHPCQTGDAIEVNIPKPKSASPIPEAIPLKVSYEDEHLLVVYKPPGMVVHPSPGHHSGTLVNALLSHCTNLSEIGGVRRLGIVHRLDRGTSGLLVVAKNDRAHQALARQFQERTVEKRYLALVYGNFPSQLAVEQPIGRDTVNRKKMSTRTGSPREAISEFKRVKLLVASTLVSARIFTGRTHQIRVHLSESGFPVVGDTDYGRARLTPGVSSAERKAFTLLHSFPRTALHSNILGFTHPVTADLLRFESPLPPDISELIEVLQQQPDKV